MPKLRPWLGTLKETRQMRQSSQAASHTSPLLGHKLSGPAVLALPSLALGGTHSALFLLLSPLLLQTRTLQTAHKVKQNTRETEQGILSIKNGVEKGFYSLLMENICSWTPLDMAWSIHPGEDVDFYLGWDFPLSLSELMFQGWGVGVGSRYFL